MTEPTETIRVLHVDDDPAFADMVAEFLEREDDHLAVETARDATEGREKLSATDYECVVSDYDMPGRDGIEFLEGVRAEHPDLPFILYTGNGSEAVASEAISAGATDYVQKRHDTSHYEILANRIRNAVEQYRATRRAADLDRVRTLVTDVNHALVRADSRESLESRICEIISDSDPYLFAWIGELDPDTDRIEPRAAGGIEEGYLDAVTVTADDAPTGQGPGGTAIRERRIATSQDIATDPEFEPWREAAIERGYRAVAAVPLEHGDTLYGELVVYADRPDAFDASERDLLAELGDDIAHAFHSLETRAQLREEREFVDQALDALDDVFYVIDEDGALLRWNARLEAVTGHAGAELADMDAVDLVPEAERERVDRVIDETLATGSAAGETALVTADGDPVPYELTASRLTDLDGDLVGLIGIGRDISDRVERERRLETLVDNLPGMVYRCANERGWPMENVRGEVEALTGYAPADIEERGRLFGTEIIHPDDREEVWDAVQRALDTGDPFDITYRITTRDGTTKWVRERGQGIFSAAGDVEALEGFVTDITDRTERRQELEATNAVLQTVLDNLTMGVLVEDADRDVLAANDTLYAVLDLPGSAADLVGRDCSRAAQEFKHLFADPEGFLRGIEARIDEREPVRGEELELADGRVLERDYVPYGLPDGEANLWLYRDVTERKRHEEDLQRQNDRLAQFSSVVSHDLRNPLNVAQGRVELAREECDSAHLDDVAAAVDRSLSLIDDLLTLAREGQTASDVGPVDLAATVEGCWGNVAVADATLVAATDQSIRADESRLKRLFENLFSNAVDHGGDEVTVTVGDLPDGFYVADDGSGIDGDDREQIFEAGYSTAGSGAGLGLNIVSQIAAAHDWQVTVTESDAGGARFEITGVETADG
ncbi:MAG: PAS domain S-box protein [Halobacteriaceae archaeon]